MKRLRICGLIMRHQVDVVGDAQFETIIAFESLVSKGTDITLQLLQEIRTLSFVSPGFPSSYLRLEDSTTSKPTVSGIAIAETNVKMKNRRADSSGKVYDVEQVSKTQQMLESFSAAVNDYGGPALDIIKTMSYSATYHRDLTYVY